MKRTIRCHECNTYECAMLYPNGMPQYCQAQKFPEVIDQSKSQYLEPQVANIHLAMARISKKGGSDWCRIQQCIEFARELGVTKVGLAVCLALLEESKEFAKYLKGVGIEVVSVGCLVGGVKGEDTGIPDEWVHPLGFSCNPIAQAEIMNREETQLNFIYGLCVGHDTLFMMHAKAPATCVSVKDTVTVNNPSAVLFSPIYRMKFDQEYGGV